MQWALKYMSDIEMYCGNIQRLVDYTNIPPEHDCDKQGIVIITIIIIVVFFFIIFITIIFVIATIVIAITFSSFLLALSQLPNCRLIFFVLIS